LIAPDANDITATRARGAARSELALENIVKRFGANAALEGASFHLRPGTVHALLGENGAGKSTLMRVAYGLVRPDSGTVRVGGRPVTIGSAADAISLGIGMVHQHFTLVPVMTIAENVALGSRGMLNIARVAARVREIAERTGFALDPSARIETLTVGAQQRVEIVKALVRQARVLILDEPTAVLAPDEARALLTWVRTYADAGNAVVLITHKLREALSVADEVTVLRRGRMVLAQSAAESTTDALATAMLGAETSTGGVASIAAPESPSDTPVVFSARRLRLSDARGVVRLREATFDVRAGEIVGIAGVDGSGQRELLRALAGRLTPDSGELTRPAEVGFIPEDRHHDAVLMDRTLTENVALRGAGARHGTIDWAALGSYTRAMMEAYTIRAPDADAPLRSLSGGNQQKLVVARELGSSRGAPPHAVVAENPTRGLDVRATAAIHTRLRQASAMGAAVVLYSNDIDEVLLLATRVLVAHDGAIHEVPLDRDRIGRAMLGAG
jgi:simple sugar transport system ATP-binding protein